MDGVDEGGVGGGVIEMKPWKDASLLSPVTHSPVNGSEIHK